MKTFLFCLILISPSFPFLFFLSFTFARVIFKKKNFVYMNIYIRSQLAFLPCCAIYAYCTRNVGSDKLIILAYARAIWLRVEQDRRTPNELKVEWGRSVFGAGRKISSGRWCESHILLLTDVVNGKVSWGLTKKGFLPRERNGMIMAAQKKVFRHMWLKFKNTDMSPLRRQCEAKNKTWYHLILKRS